MVRIVTFYLLGHLYLYLYSSRNLLVLFYVRETLVDKELQYTIE